MKEDVLLGFRASMGLPTAGVQQTKKVERNAPPGSEETIDMLRLLVAALLIRWSGHSVADSVGMDAERSPAVSDAMSAMTESLDEFIGEMTHTLIPDFRRSVSVWSLPLAAEIRRRVKMKKGG